jgi:hypothetical protein
VNEEQILVEIKEQLVALNSKIEDVKVILQNDRSNMWKLLAMTIVAAFAIIGVKIAAP